MHAIINARTITPDGVRAASVIFDAGVITAIAKTADAIPAGATIVDAQGRYLAPGLIDIHVHGGGGFDLMTDDAEQVRSYARWVAARGVTSFLVSTSGRDHAQFLDRLRAIAPVVGTEAGSARVLGFHLEGPYINPVRKGAFDPRWLRAPSADEYRALFDASGNAIRQITLAPELPGAAELIDAVLASGATVAIGHTDATYDEAMAAIERGASHATHCFNAMRPFSHRDPGCLGAIMTSDSVTAELIGDGAHVDYAAARVLIRAKGARNIVLITDGMPLAGTADGDGEWEGVPIRVDGGKAVRVSDGTIIGGVITLDQTLRNAVTHMGVAVHEAVAMASTNAARAIGLAAHGAIVEGVAADFILLDNDLRVTETWVAGERVYPRQ